MWAEIRRHTMTMLKAMQKSSIKQQRTYPICLIPYRNTSNNIFFVISCNFANKNDVFQFYTSPHVLIHSISLVLVRTFWFCTLSTVHTRKSSCPKRDHANANNKEMRSLRTNSRDKNLTKIRKRAFLSLAQAEKTAYAKDYKIRRKKNDVRNVFCSALGSKINKIFSIFHSNLISTNMNVGQYPYYHPLPDTSVLRYLPDIDNDIVNCVQNKNDVRITGPPSDWQGPPPSHDWIVHSKDST